MFPRCFTVRHPNASNNDDLIPGGFLTPKLSKLEPSSRGDALLLGGSLLSGARTILLEGRTSCDVVKRLLPWKELGNPKFTAFNLTFLIRLRSHPMFPLRLNNNVHSLIEFKWIFEVKYFHFIFVSAVLDLERVEYLCKKVNGLYFIIS